MKKICLCLAAALLLLTGILSGGCAGQNRNFTLKVVPPQNLQQPLKGTWEIVSPLQGEEGPVSPDLVQKWVGKKLYFAAGCVLLGDYFLPNPRFQVKKVPADIYLFYRHQVFPESFRSPDPEIEVFTLSDDRLFFCELLQEKDDTLWLNLFNSGFRACKISDAVDETVFASLEAAGETAETPGIGEQADSAGNQTGVLLGLRAPAHGQGEGAGCTGDQYRTLWLAQADQKLAPVLETKAILFPRRSGFYRLQVVNREEGKKKEDLLVVEHLLKQEEKQAEDQCEDRDQAQDENKLQAQGENKDQGKGEAKGPAQGENKHQGQAEKSGQEKKAAGESFWVASDLPGDEEKEQVKVTVGETPWGAPDLAGEKKGQEKAGGEPSWGTLNLAAEEKEQEKIAPGETQTPRGIPDPADEEKCIARRLCFISNDYVSIEETISQPSLIGGSTGEESRLHVFAVDSLPGMKAVKISDLAGPDAAAAMAHGRQKLLTQRGLEQTGLLDEKNFGLARKMGYWIFNGRVNYRRQDVYEKAGYNIMVVPPDEVICYNKLYIPWTRVKNHVPGAVDVFTSPGKDLALVITNNEIIVYGMDQGNLAGPPLEKIPLKAGEEVIMAEWALGHYVEDWTLTFKSFLAQEGDTQA